MVSEASTFPQGLIRVEISNWYLRLYFEKSPFCKILNFSDLHASELNDNLGASKKKRIARKLVHDFSLFDFTYFKKSDVLSGEEENKYNVTATNGCYIAEKARYRYVHYEIVICKKKDRHNFSRN